MGTSEIDSMVVSAGARWRAIAVRLGLGEPAIGLVADLLRGELETGAPDTMRRIDLVARSGLEREPALASLVDLERRGIVHAHDAAAIAWIDGPIALDARVREACLGLAPSRAIEGAEAEISPRLAREVAVAARLARRGPVFVVIRGRSGSGRDVVLRSWLAAIGSRAIAITPSELLTRRDGLEPELSGAAVVWDARGRDPSPDDRSSAAALLERASVAVAILDAGQDAPVLGRATIELVTDPVDHDERRWIWARALASCGSEIDDPRLDLVASALRVGIGLAHRAAAAQSELGAPSLEVLRARVESLVQPSALRGIAIERAPVPLERIQGSPAVHRALDHVVELATRPRSAGDRPGVKALFAGAPGTGKTLAARALATELARSLYRIDLAAVTSKWLGETEKNLARAFEIAEATGAVLLFDEGEALMGQRSDVSRGSDRYANLEVAYLLQALESHDGIVVVTTNARERMDKAFIRRFDVIADFARPDADARESLWRQELGDRGRALDGTTLRDVAERADLTGGHIAAAARLARVLAAAAGSDHVRGVDLIEAVACEHEKLGGVLTANRWRAERRPGAGP